MATSSAGISGTTFDETLANEKVPSGYGPFFMIEDSEWSYETYGSSIEGNFVQPCMADFPISKQDRDLSIFQSYNLTAGARIYADSSDTEPITMP